MQKKLSIVGALAFLTLGLAVMASATSAQYPPPVGGVEAGASQTTAAPGESVLLTCTVLGPNGAPVANEPCTFTIVSQPGNDAAVGSTTVTKLTDAQGIATTNLYVGSTPGVVVVDITASGMSSSVLVVVDGAAPAPPQGPIDGGTGGGIQPPSTGSGGLK
jgi:hypothetical protein